MSEAETGGSGWFSLSSQTRSGNNISEWDGDSIHAVIHFVIQKSQRTADFQIWDFNMHKWVQKKSEG